MGTGNRACHRALQTLYPFRGGEDFYAFKLFKLGLQPAPDGVSQEYGGGVLRAQCQGAFLLKNLNHFCDFRVVHIVPHNNVRFTVLVSHGNIP